MRSHWKRLKGVWEAPGNRGRRLRALCRMAFWFGYKRLGGKGIWIRVFGGLRFWCRPQSLIAEHVLYSSEWVEYDEMSFIKTFLRHGDVFLDVGANVGLHTLLAASCLGSHGRIVAVEPHPGNLIILRENLRRNALQNVRLLELAAGARNEELSLGESDVFAEVRPAAAEGLRVPVRRLDGLLAEEGDFALAKVDVEGYEWMVMDGMQKLLGEGRLPVVLFELIGHMRRLGLDENAFCEWWRQQGYQLAKYQHERRILCFEGQPRGDVLAFSPKGMAMLRERMPDVRVIGHAG